MPLGVGWLFQDVTEAKQAEQEAAMLRFRTNQLHRAARAAAECEDPAEAATVHLDFALAGFADHALIDRVAGGAVPDHAAGGETPDPVRLVRVAVTPSGAPGPSRLGGEAGLPVRYAEGHPALQCVARAGSVRADAGSCRRSGRVSGPWRGSGRRTRCTCCARCCGAGAGRWAS